MKIRQFKILAVALAALTLTAAACTPGAKAGDQSTPTLAYKALYEAVKKKDPEAIKKTLSKGTLEMMETYAGMQKKTLNEVVENGLTETTFAPKLPETRNEKITGDLAILEVKNEKNGQWEALPFAKEDGAWKLAIDTFFKGTMSPKGPTNPENPGQLPPGTQSGPPQEVKPGQQPEGINPQAPPPAMSPGKSGQTQPPPPAPAPTQGAKPSAPPKTGIKPPQR
jgi:hypothetical protein